MSGGAPPGAVRHGRLLLDSDDLGERAILRLRLERQHLVPNILTVTPDADAPQTSVTCNGGSDCDGSYTGNVQVASSASDSGPGVNKISLHPPTAPPPPARLRQLHHKRQHDQRPRRQHPPMPGADNVGDLENTQADPRRRRHTAPALHPVERPTQSDFVDPGHDRFYNPQRPQAASPSQVAATAGGCLGHVSARCAGICGSSTTSTTPVTDAACSWTSDDLGRRQPLRHTSNGRHLVHQHPSQSPGTRCAQQISITACNSSSNYDGRYTTISRSP